MTITLEEQSELTNALNEVEAVARASIDQSPEFNSAHEAFCVLEEKRLALWARVTTNRQQRDLSDMRSDAVQVAAMAVRFAIEVCNEERGRK